MDLTSERRDLRDAVRGLRAAAAAGGRQRPVFVASPVRRDRCGRPRHPRTLRRSRGRSGRDAHRDGGTRTGADPSALLGSAVLAAQALLATGDEAACQRLLPAIAAGPAIAAVAWTGPVGRWDPVEAACEARFSPDGWALTGEAHYVLDGDVADVLLAAARTPDGIALFEMDPLGGGVTRTPVTAMDTTRRLAVVRLTGAACELIGTGGDLDGAGLRAAAQAPAPPWPGRATWPASRSAPSRWARRSGPWS